MKRFLLFTAFAGCAFFAADAQRFNVGVTFQYYVLKQVQVDTDVLQGTHSYNRYVVNDNRWKFFSAGQSIVIGTVLQMDYKKFYAVLEPSFNLNTYQYAVGYPVSNDRDETLVFQTLFLQGDFPLYVGYQFGSTNLIRYSVFGGAVLSLPYMLEASLQSKELENPQEDYFDSNDMNQILYNERGYGSALAGFCFHFASLGKVDIRYQRRIGSPGKDYAVQFHSIGVGVTYYLPLNIRKRKIYYEE